jgi:ribosomal protein S18 acetylase RimI-like enzyme
MEAALDYGQSQGVKCMYVHVEASNAAAKKCYQDVLGFTPEAEETENDERLLSRPRRLLLVRRLDGEK